MRDEEGRVRVGTRGWVTYLTGKRIDVEVVYIQLGDDGKLYAKCEEGSGDCRWFPLKDVHTT